MRLGGTGGRLLPSYLYRHPSHRRPTIKPTLPVLARTLPLALLAPAEAFWQAYQGEGSPAKGCAAAGAYATAHPEALDSLGQYGYGNPSYEAGDVCFLR